MPGYRTYFNWSTGKDSALNEALDIRTLAPGAYLIYMTDGNQLPSRRLVKIVE